MLAVMGTSICLYLFGLVLNDLFDLEADRAERPDRPLPSGQITMLQAKAAAFAAALSGLNIAMIAGWPALYVAGALAVAILSYNVLKRIPVVGICTMGICRGLSFLLGVVVALPELFFSPTPSGVLGVPAATVSIAYVTTFAYVIAFSAIAKNEMADEKPMGVKRWMPFVVLLVGLPCVLFCAGLGEGVIIISYVSIFLMCMAIWWSWMLGGTLYRLQPVPKTVAGHIRNLLLVQACLCVAAGDAGVFPALFLFALWILFPRLAKRFYSS